MPILVMSEAHIFFSYTSPGLRPPELPVPGKALRVRPIREFGDDITHPT